MSEEKMDPLVTNKKMLMWLCILPAQAQTNQNMKLLYIVTSFTLLTSCFLGLIASVAFMVKYLSTNLEDCLYALFQVSGDASALYMILIAFILRRQIAALFDQLSEIYCASKSPF